MKLLSAALWLALAAPAAAAPDPADWPSVLDAAEGQTVYWYGRGGDTRTNDFIAWVGRQVAERYGVTLEYVKLADTAEAVSRVLAEKTAGRDTNGAEDLIWINGENFAAMKEAELLYGPFAEELPNWRFVDTADKPVRTDFTVPTDGLESPWAAAQVVFFYDSARLAEPPRTMAALLDWAEANPGRFTYPQPPNFLGTTFLKQALYGLVDEPAVLPCDRHAGGSGLARHADLRGDRADALADVVGVPRRRRLRDRTVGLDRPRPLAVGDRLDTSARPADPAGSGGHRDDPRPRRQGSAVPASGDAGPRSVRRRRASR